MADKYWLLKAEPDSRVVKGKDVKFSVDDFEAVKTSPWEGVRNYEARNLMKEMKTGEKALFYHSNCKNPGVAAFAKVSKEAYPDYTAWDPSHPYFDPKSDSENPKWFMVDLTFDSRAEHFVPLSLLRYIADSSSIPPEVEYIGDAGFQAIKTMGLVRRGRLSVQRVEPAAWEAITQMTTKGGWDDLALKGKPAAGGGTKKAAPKPKAEAAEKSTPTKRKAPARKKAKPAPAEIEESELSELSEDEDSEEETKKKKPRGKKGGTRAKIADEEESYVDSDEDAGRKSKRGKKRKANDEDDGEYKSPVRTKSRR